jgi:hypothetical protein
MAHFDIPLDLPHAGRLAGRILRFVERCCEELGVEAGEVIELAEQLDALLFKYVATEENPGESEAGEVRDKAAALGRLLVEELERANIAADRLGQFIRNLFECLELGEEGAAISLRAGENPESLQRPT